jgi:signal transduction histidine kinase/AraC-like DNA-binding protein
MQKHKDHYQHDGLSEILRAYKLPIVIVTIGMILSIGSFLLALRYDIQQSEQSFQNLSDQVYRNFEAEINRHRRMTISLSRVLSELTDLSKTEFSDIAQAFTSSSLFAHINLYKVVETRQKLENQEDQFLIKKYFSRTPYEVSDENTFETPELITAIEKSGILKGNFVSKPFEIISENNVKNYVVISAPLSEKKEKGLFLVFVLDIQELFNQTLKRDNANLSVRVYSADKNGQKEPDTSQPAERVVYEYFIDEQSKNFLASARAKELQTITSKKEYYLDDYFWHIDFYPSIQNFGSNIGLFPLITFSSFMTITILLSFIVFRIKAEQVRTQEIVMEQTKDLQAYTRKLEASNRDLDEFAYIASHDLKEPLRGIYNYAEFLLEDYGDKLEEEAGKKLNTMKKLARRMEKLVESLHDYSRLSRIEMSREVVETKDIVDDVIDTMEAWLEENKAKVSIEGDLPAIECDPVRTTEVFRNLITNAVKYNNKSIKMVAVGVKQSEKPGVPVFYVRDNGIGIAKEHISSIFKIFKRLHGRDEYGGGTGSGLTIVAKIIERHGGKIWVQSEPNKGTTFFFTLKEEREKKDDT